MPDLLRLDYINSLPQPLFADTGSGTKWPVYDIDVETGLMRLDVCGMLDISHVGKVLRFVDCNGDVHDADTFYTDCEEVRDDDA